MLATICAVVIATQELVCSVPIDAQAAEILATSDDVHLFTSGDEMFDTKTQPTGHLFTISENDPRWPQALAASARKRPT